MKSPDNLKGIRKQVYRAIRQDGLEILAAGIFLALIAVFFIDIKFGGVFGIATVLYIVLPEALRRKYVYPRIGYAKCPDSGTITKRIVILIIVAVVIAAFGFIGHLTRLNWMMPIFLGVVFSTIYLYASHKAGTITDYVITTLLFISGAVGLIFTLSGWDAGYVTAIQLWSLSAILIPVGIIQFIKFLDKFEKPAEEVFDGISK